MKTAFIINIKNMDNFAPAGVLEMSLKENFNDSPIYFITDNDEILDLCDKINLKTIEYDEITNDYDKIVYMESFHLVYNYIENLFELPHLTSNKTNTIIILETNKIDNLHFNGNKKMNDKYDNLVEQLDVMVSNGKQFSRDFHIINFMNKKPWNSEKFLKPNMLRAARDWTKNWVKIENNYPDENLDKFFKISEEV